MQQKGASITIMMKPAVICHTPAIRHIGEIVMQFHAPKNIDAENISFIAFMISFLLEIPEAARIAAVLQRYFIHQGMPSADSESVPPAPGKSVLLTLSMAWLGHLLC